MQPQNQFDPSANQPPQPQQPTSPPPTPPQPVQQANAPVPPTNLGQPQQPLATPTQAYNADPGKTLSTVGLITGIFVPIAGIPISAFGMSKSKRAGFDGKLGKTGIIVGSISAALGIILFIVMTIISLTTANTILDKASKDLGVSSDGKNNFSISSDKEAFGVKYGMSRTDVEKVLGKPEPLIGDAKNACKEMSASFASTAGYDTSCYYMVGKAEGASSITPYTLVNYLDDKLESASKLDADGSSTILNKNGVTTTVIKNE